MAKPSNILISTIKRNQIFRGPAPSAAINSLQDEVIRDLTAIQQQYNSFIVPLVSTLPDGTVDSSVDAFRNGLDGRTLFVHSLATNTGAEARYYNSLKGRPNTTYEQFVDVYSYIDSALEELGGSLSTSGSGGALTTQQKDKIGANIFNSNVSSSPSSLDGKTSRNELNILQIAKDVYGESSATLSGNGSPVLNNSVKDMLDALLELHGGDYDSNLSLSHDLSASDITTGTLLQNIVGPSSGASGGVNDNYTGTPSNLVDDLNLVRTLIKNLKGTANFNTAISAGPSWSALTTSPDSIVDILALKGSSSRTNNNPWGYHYSDIDGLPSELTDLSSDLTDLSSDISNHIADTTNPHSVTLTQVASAGGSAPASQIAVTDANNYFTSSNVEEVLEEIWEYVSTISGVNGGGGSGEILSFDAPLVKNVTNVSLPAATSTEDGYLKKEDWATFSGKENALTFSEPLFRSSDTISIPALTGIDTLVWSANVEIDLALTLPVRKSLTLAGDTTFTTANDAPGRDAIVIITCDGTDRTLTFPSGWKWLGLGEPTTIAANSTGVLSLTVTNTNVVASFVVDGEPEALTAVTASSPLTGSGTSGSPLELPAASSVQDGYLSSLDYNIFSSKESPLTFSGALVRTLNDVTVQAASAAQQGVVTTETQTFAGVKTFTSEVKANAGVRFADSVLQTKAAPRFVQATAYLTNYDASHHELPDGALRVLILDSIESDPEEAFDFSPGGSPPDTTWTAPYNGYALVRVNVAAIPDVSGTSNTPGPGRIRLIIEHEHSGGGSYSHYAFAQHDTDSKNDWDWGDVSGGLLAEGGFSPTTNPFTEFLCSASANLNIKVTQGDKIRVFVQVSEDKMLLIGKADSPNTLGMGIEVTPYSSHCRMTVDLIEDL